MNRMLPVTTQDHPISVRARWRPDGAHLCEIGVGHVELRLKVGEVDRMIEALKNFKAEQVSEDGGPGARTNETVKAIGEF